jgi:hypothetical protein
MAAYPDFAFFSGMCAQVLPAPVSLHPYLSPSRPAKRGRSVHQTSPQAKRSRFVPEELSHIPTPLVSFQHPPINNFALLPSFYPFPVHQITFGVSSPPEPASKDQQSSTALVAPAAAPTQDSTPAVIEMTDASSPSVTSILIPLKSTIRIPKDLESFLLPPLPLHPPAPSPKGTVVLWQPPQGSIHQVLKRIKEITESEKLEQKRREENYEWAMEVVD